MRADIFFRRPRLTVLAIAFTLVAGLLALGSLPRQEDPALTQRFAQLNVTLPGASAERVEALITEKIESKVQEIAEIKHFNSRSKTGIAVMTMQLDDAVNDVDPVWSRVRDRIGEVALPEGAGVPDFRINTTAAFTLLVGIKGAEPGVGIDLLHRIAKDLRQRLIAISGTREVELYGEPDEEVLVTVRAAALERHALSAVAVSDAIAAADPKISAGRLEAGLIELPFEVSGQLDSLDRIRQVPVVVAGGGRSSAVRVGDIARVERVPLDPPRTMALIHGTRGIVVAAKVDERSRVDLWAGAARKEIANFQAALPAGVSADIVFDQSVHTDERLDSLTNNLLLGAGLVIGVLLVMMGWRSALLVSSALPVTVLLVIAALKFLDVPLHQISMTGLIIALGLLIDNAIVAVDEYNRQRARGHGRGEAIEASVRHLFVPLLASTVTTVLTFMPLVIMPGNAGEFVSTLGVSVVLSVVFSFLLSVSIVPALAAFVDRQVPSAHGRGFWAHGLSAPAVARGYRRVVRASIRHPVLGIGAALILPVAGFAVAPQLVEQFFPPVDRNQFQMQLTLPNQSSIYGTERAVQAVRERLLARPEVENTLWFLGESPPRVFYNVTINSDGDPSFAGGYVTTRSAEATHAIIGSLQAEMLAALPDIFVLALPFEQGPPVSAPLEVRIYGPDVDELRRLGEEVRLLMSRTKNVTFSRASIDSARPNLRLVVDEDAARLGGFGLMDVARDLNARLDGITGGSVLEATEELPVRVRLDAADRATLERVLASAVRPGGGAADGRDAGTSLAAIARIGLAPQTDQITRRDGSRVNTVQGFVTPYSLPAEALADFQRRLAQSGLVLPAGYRMDYGGEAEGSGEARGDLLSVFGPLLVLMVGTVVLAFNSFRLGAVIIVIAILSVGCALLSLWTFSFPMGFMAVIGCMGLIGVAINDSIVVMSALKADPRALGGDIEAMTDVVVDGTRHVLSTTLTTVGGFAPLMIWGGIFWPPLATAVAGGVIGATLLALFFVPPVFRVLTRPRRRAAEIVVPA